MSNFLVTAEGGLTAAGYGVSIAAAILLFLIGGLVKGHSKKGQTMSTKQMVFCAMAMALSFLTSYIKLFSAPWGGSITLCSMLFICLIGNWYGVRVGYSDRTCLWHSPVPSGTFCPFLFPGML